MKDMIEDTKVKQLTEASGEDDGDILVTSPRDEIECDEDDCTEDDRCWLCTMDGMPARDI